MQRAVTRGVVSRIAAELGRRRIWRAAALYVVASWIGIQVASTVFPLLDLPLVASKAVLAVAIVGFAPAMVLAWFYDFRFASGLSRTADLAAAPAPEPSAEASIVVLPFANLSPSPDDAYFSDGMAEEITNALAKIEGLRVVSRTSAYSFRGKDVSTAEIGARLKVGFVLEGSMRRVEDRLRLGIKLARVRDDRVLWAEQYERVLTDVFGVQDEITARVVGTLTGALALPRAAAPARVTPARSLQAYDLYLLGRHHWNRRNEAGMRRALELFEEALRIEPGYAPAYSGIADATAILASWNFALPATMFPRASGAAYRAIALDDSLAEAHASLGFVKYNWEWDWAGAVRELSRAIELNPNFETAHRWLSGFLAGIGRDAEALPIARRVPALDPLSVLPHMNLGLVHYLANRLDDALEEFERVLEMDPSFVRGYVFQAAALAFSGRHDEAQAVARRVVQIANGAAVAVFTEGLCYALAGRRDVARPLFEATLSQPMLHGMYMAMMHLAMGDEKAMYAELERGLRERGDWMYSLGQQPAFREVRSQPRFQDLLDRLNVTGDRALEPLPVAG